MTARVILNGTSTVLDASSLAEYLALRGYDADRKGIAVALNDQVVPRSRWSETDLKDGDRLEIVEPVQGG